MKNFNDNDLELFSAYVDGRLDSAASTRVESRVSADPDVASVLADLRFARSVLRSLPKRKAPRNFTLTRKMVGMNPPLPRAYSFFQFSSAFATMLLIFTFALNALTSSRVSLDAASAPAAPVSAQATEAPAMQAPAATQASAMEMSVPATASADSAGGGNPTVAAEAPNAKEAPPPSSSPNQPKVKREAAIPVAWQIGLIMIGLLSVFGMFALRQFAKRKWL
jgi:anti-sigma factor RsiW